MMNAVSGSYIMVPEALLQESVVDAQAQGKEEEVINFKRVLDVGEVYKSAEMHPLYLFDQKTYNIVVVAEETFGKRLH